MGIQRWLGPWQRMKLREPNEASTSAMRRAKQALGRVLLRALPINRRAFDILRFEFGCLAQRLGNLLNPSYHIRIRDLKKTKDISLNLGSGGKGFPGWINIDARRHSDSYITHDIRRPLPLDDNQVTRIFAEHVIEHLDFRGDIAKVFSEFYRVLKPLGTVRIIVPDAERFLQAYVDKSEEGFKQLGWNIDQMPGDIYTPMHIINHIFHQEGEHLFGWDFDTMAFSLRHAGFVGIERCSFGVSSDPLLALDQRHHAPYSLVVEAKKGRIKGNPI